MVSLLAGSSEAKNSSSKETTTTSSTASSAGKETLIVYSAQGYSPNGVKAFEKETGIPTKLVENSTGPLFARIQAEKADPHWGLFWVDGAEPFASLDEQGMLVKSLEVPKLTSLGEKLLPADRSFVPTGITLACAVIYNSKEVASPPTTWQQLTESKYAGKIGMNDPAVSGPTYPCIAGVMNYLGSETKGKEFFEKLKKNGLKISETNGNTLHLLETGQIFDWPDPELRGDRRGREGEGPEGRLPAQGDDAAEQHRRGREGHPGGARRGSEVHQLGRSRPRASTRCRSATPMATRFTGRLPPTPSRARRCRS